MSNQIETREIETDVIEIREENSENKTIVGYAVKWNKPSETLGFSKRFKEVFVKGAFKESLQNDDQRALWSHDTSKVLGRTKNNTLRLFEDDVGLRIELDLPNTTLGIDTYKTVKRGDIDGVSFGFRMQKQFWDDKDKNNIIRKITKAKLLEISPVAFPAYPDSLVSARSHDPYMEYCQNQDEELRRKKLIIKTYL